MSYRRNGLVFAMEEAAVGVDPEVPPLVDVPGEVESDIADVATGAADMDNLSAAIEEAMADVDQLEGIHDQMGASVEDGGTGVDPTAAAIAEVAVEAIYTRLGIRKSAMPAMESFGGTGSRVTATKIAMEGIRESMTKGIEAVKKFIAELWAKFRNWLTNTFSAGASIQKTANAMIASIGKVTNNEPSSATITNSAVFNALALDGKVDLNSVNTLLANHVMTLANTAMVIDSSATAVTGIKPILDKLAKAQEGDIAETITNVKKIVGGMWGGIKGFETDKSSQEGMSASKSKPLVDGKELVILTSSTDGAGKATVKVQVQDINPNRPKGENCAMLKQGEIAAVLKEVAKLGADILDLKKAQQSSGNFEKAVNQLLDQAVKSFSAVKGQEDGVKGQSEAISVVKNTVSSLATAANGYCTQAPTLAIRMAKMTMNYMSACLKQYNVKTEKPEAPAAPAAPAKA